MPGHASGTRPFDADRASRSKAPTVRPVRSAHLILRYGTPASGLGRGPSFRLVRGHGAASRST